MKDVDEARKEKVWNRTDMAPGQRTKAKKKNEARQIMRTLKCIASSNVSHKKMPESLAFCVEKTRMISL